jgi:hypothetical protein
MATARTAAFAVGNIVTLATVPYERKLRMTDITIDNSGGSADHIIYFRDDVTIDPSIGTPAGSSQTLIRAQYPVPKGLMLVIKADELREKEFLGTLKCYADSADPNCLTVVDYEYF